MVLFSRLPERFRPASSRVKAIVSKALSFKQPAVRRHRVRRDLAALNDRTLADIGISRTVSVYVSWPHRHLRAPH